MTKYNNLSQQQINSITKHYENQKTIEDIKHFFYEVEEELDIETDYITIGIDDKNSDILLYGKDGTKDLFTDFGSTYAFGSDLQTALKMINNILYWARNNTN